MHCRHANPYHECTTPAELGEIYCSAHRPQPLTSERQIGSASRIARRLSDAKVLLLAVESDAKRAGLLSDAVLVGGLAATVAALVSVVESRARAASVKLGNGGSLT